jgi:uncharacterized protein with HEPN domain
MSASLAALLAARKRMPVTWICWSTLIPKLIRSIYSIWVVILKMSLVSKSTWGHLHRCGHSFEMRCWQKPSSWLADILDAIAAIQEYLAEGSLNRGLIYDACRVRLIEIGEAVKNIDPNLLATLPSIRWRAISRMKDHLAHHYFDTDHALVEYVIHEELVPLREAIVTLTEKVAEMGSDQVEIPQSDGEGEP